MGLLERLSQIGYYVVPPGIKNLMPQQTRQRIARQLLPASTRAILDRNRALERKHAGERCFILATGPSIKQQDLTPLKNETCISVSNFFVHPAYATIKPAYHCLAPHHPPITEEAWQDWLTELYANAPEETTFLYSLTDKTRNESNQAHRPGNSYFIRFVGGADKTLAESIDLTAPLPAPQSVSIMAVSAAIYMGFSEIYLLGCDHDWFVNHKQASHFYPEEKNAMKRRGYDEKYNPSVEWALRSALRLWEQYGAIKTYIGPRGVSIFNATPGSQLDVFPRVTLDDVIAGPPASTAGQQQ